jgi:prevent-host-death family protein
MSSIDVRDIHSLTDFQQNARAYIDRVKASRNPFVVTVDGSAEVVVQDAGSYQEMVDRLRELEDMAAIRNGVAQAVAGNTRPALEALLELRQRHGV